MNLMMPNGLCGTYGFRGPGQRLFACPFAQTPDPSHHPANMFRKNGISVLILGIQPYDHMGAGPVGQDCRYFAPDPHPDPRSEGGMKPQVLAIVDLRGQYFAREMIKLDKIPQTLQNRPGNSHAEHGWGQETIRSFIIEIARVGILDRRCIVCGVPPGYFGRKFLERGTGQF
jgi:hypothetical protein